METFASIVCGVFFLRNLFYRSYLDEFERTVCRHEGK